MRYYVGGELGGNKDSPGGTFMKWATSATFVLMWFAFIVIVSLVEYDHIDPGF